MVPIRRAVAKFVAHYHGERNHQGLVNELIEDQPLRECVGRMRRRQRLGGLLNYYASSVKNPAPGLRVVVGHYGLGMA